MIRTIRIVSISINPIKNPSFILSPSETWGINDPPRITIGPMRLRRACVQECNSGYSRWSGEGLNLPPCGTSQRHGPSYRPPRKTDPDGQQRAGIQKGNFSTSKSTDGTGRIRTCMVRFGRFHTGMSSGRSPACSPPQFRCHLPYATGVSTNSATVPVAGFSPAPECFHLLGPAKVLCYYPRHRPRGTMSLGRRVCSWGRRESNPQIQLPLVLFTFQPQPQIEGFSPSTRL